MRSIVPQIHAAGSELVVLGNGTSQHAEWFIEATGLETPVFTDPERAAYRAVGARRNLLGVLHPAVFLRTVQAWRQGFRQADQMGDAMQLGGVFIVMPDGSIPYARRSRYAGDLPDPAEIVRRLEGASNAVGS